MKTTPLRRWQPLAAAALMALPGTAALADEGTDRSVQIALADLPAMDFALDFDEASFDFAAGELGDGRVAKGAPYCADAVHETVQPLADGNRIVRRQQSRLCRDGEGRTRQEVERNGRKLVWLRDPVAKQAWLLDPERKTARRLGAHAVRALGFDAGGADAGNAEAWRAFAERAREQAHEAAARAREHAREALAHARGMPATQGPLPPEPPPPQPALITRGPAPADAPPAAGDKAGKAPAGRPLEIQVLRLPEPPVPPAAPLPPAAIRWQAQHAAPRGPGALNSLGSKDIEGLPMWT